MEKRRRGRPIKPGGSVRGERVPLSLRVSAEVRDELEQAAIQSGRSLSQEAEFRLETSFEREFLLKAMQKWLRKEFKK
jgi:hypothetical protein